MDPRQKRNRELIAAYYAKNPTAIMKHAVADLKLRHETIAAHLREIRRDPSGPAVTPQAVPQSRSFADR